MPAPGLPTDRRRWRAALLVGASVTGLAAPMPARAQTVSVLRGAAGLAAPTVPLPMPAAATNASVLTAAQTSASARALANQARAQASLNLAQQAQTAARASASAGGVPNGLVAGGLVPVANASLAAIDTTGLRTWQGAGAPRTVTIAKAADGTVTRNETPVDPTGQTPVTIDIQQTDKQAILSWESFNVGKDTTLNFIQRSGPIDPKTGLPTTAQPGWIALNRVVAGIDPATGLRTGNAAPSQILGQIRSDGTVLVLNQNGVLFGPTAQVNTNSLVVSSLEIGRARALVGTQLTPLTLQQRNAEFLNFGLLGYADQASATEATNVFTFAPVAIDTSADDPVAEGSIVFEQGAQVTSGDGGFVIALAPRVENHGTLASTNGQVSLASGRRFLLQRSEGTATSLDPNVRGLIVASSARNSDMADYVHNDGIVQSPRGYLSLTASQGGAVFNDGLLTSITSVSRNGDIALAGGTISIGANSTIWITPDSGTETIPQSMDSIEDFKTSQITIGDALSNIQFAGGSLLLAPSANVRVGAPTGAATNTVTDATATGARIFVDGSATFDVGGAKDVLVPATRNEIRIAPVKRNELRDTPTLKESFLNGATVYVDPRLSGVRADGVRWVGSPLIEAESYYAQVGIGASELMTKGGTISLGTSSFAGTLATTPPDVIVKQGAQFDISGGWVRYEAGIVKTSRLITAAGTVVDIGSADPNGSYVGVVSGDVESSARWGVTTTYGNPVLTGQHATGAYTEGRDAGALTIKASAIAFDGSIEAAAYAGAQQRNGGVSGTASGRVYGDRRMLQGATSQLPAGGYLDIQALGTATVGGLTTGGGDIRVASGADYMPLGAAFGAGSPATIDADGNLVLPTRGEEALLPAARRDTILLSGDALRGAGLGQVTLQTSGAIAVDAGVALELAPGGVFVGAAGRAIRIDGSIAAAGGTIDLQTYEIPDGNIFVDDPEAAGSFDVTVNGTLSTRGRWANDFRVTDPTLLAGRGFTSGGRIRIAAAPRVSIVSAGDPNTALDISGSILVNAGALLDVSGGGHVDTNGAIDTGAAGGSISLIEQTNYAQLSATPVPGNETEGNVPGFRVTTNPAPRYAVNPSQINARIAIADGAIRAHGFAGGGTFSLETPAFQLGDGTGSAGITLPLDFFSASGFGSYRISSYGTALSANRFANGLGGYNAVLATQTVTVGAGQTLNLSQSRFQPLLSTDQIAALDALATGGSLYTVLTPGIAPEAYDRRGVDLTFGGLLELHVAQGGAITGDRGASLTIPKLYNEGTIRLVGGTLTQSQTLPQLYAGAFTGRALSDFFTYAADGTIDEGADNALGATNGQGTVLSNAQLAAQPLYLLGLLDANEGVRLTAGSRTDLSGASIRTPRPALSSAMHPGTIVQGDLIAGGMFETASSRIVTTAIFDTPAFGESVYNNALVTLAGTRPGLLLDAQPGAIIDLSGAADTYTFLNSSNRYVDTAVWSDAGTLALGADVQLTGATIAAHGGAPRAAGGTLTMLDPTLVALDPASPDHNIISAAAIAAAGFDSFTALGSLTGSGDVSLTLGRSFFLASRPFDGAVGNIAGYTPVIRADGNLAITAPYVGLTSIRQGMVDPVRGTSGAGAVTLAAGTLDVRGAVLFDQSVRTVNLTAQGDVRLGGAQPYQLTLGLDTSQVANSLVGQLVVNGDLNITAAQLYPTTGSTFLIGSTAAAGTITIAQAGATPKPPYSAGGDLLIQAASIVQGGTVRVPLGSLTLGGTAALAGGGRYTPGATGITFAPATASVTLLDGSTTSVSANGLSIPYGTTTDQIEYYFTPTSADPLKAPPAGVLHLAGASVALDPGATVDVRGGGDVFAYEFVPGTGGSRDVLSRFNTDPYSGNDGYQYPDQRQVYAIVPGMSAEAAAYDPIYSEGYDSIYGAAAVGRSVYLQSVPGLAAGWYTLLPARYATLPGGIRIVQQSGAAAPLDGVSTLKDGTVLATGYYGTAGTNVRGATPVLFSLQTQAVFEKYSNIVLTSANTNFAAIAAANGVAAPRLPIDAGRLILEPLERLALEASLDSTPATGGRGALADISGSRFAIVGDPASVTVPDGAITLSAAGLTNLNAQSLLIGGIRADNADGTTDIRVTATAIDVLNDAAHALSAPEIILATDGAGASLTLAAGAVVAASGTLSDTNTAAYVLDGSSAAMTGQGGFVRVANGAERLLKRRTPDPVATAPVLAVGAATISGTSVLLDSSGNFTVDPGLSLRAGALALGASSVRFGGEAGDGGGLLVSPALEAAIATSKTLRISAPGAIAFGAGTHAFGAVAFDTPVLASSGVDGMVTVTATSLTLGNSGGATPGCVSCGGGALTLDAGSIAFTGGSITTSQFGGGTTLNASGGIGYSGQGGLDSGSGALAIATPSIADAAVALLPGIETILPKLTLASAGAVAIAGPSGATPGSGTPGAALSIDSSTISISGTRLRATAGALTLDAPGDILLAGGAVLETPGYAKIFGDATDGYSVAAPGGLLHLVSRTGNVSLDAASRLSVGGGSGEGGALLVSAQQGVVTLDGTIDGSAPEGGGSLGVITGGGFDFDRFASAPAGFDGTIAIHAGTGDLVLAAGHGITARSLTLAADSGQVSIAGTIDTSGVSGGAVSLYGGTGVTLASTAVIDASAAGYPADDSRRSSGGDVTLGTDRMGTIAVAAGATIDLSATRPGDRLVTLTRNGQTYYSFVQGDLGGTLRLRAPFLGDGTVGTVGIDFAGTVTGARTVAIEAFRRYDLAAIANDPAFSGVTIQNGVAVLDAGAIGGDGANFLSGMGAGTIASFIQGFDIGGARARWGEIGTAAFDAIRVEQPGIELDYAGDIRLASNWNFGAGTIDTDAALAAGALHTSDKLDGRLVVTAGREADLLENYTTMLYRVSGSIRGAPGALTLRAAGNLSVDGAIGDGTFTFGDQTDRQYLGIVLGGDTSIYAPTYTASCLPANCTVIPDYGTPSSATINVNLTALLKDRIGGGVIKPTPLPDDIPYVAAKNDAAASGGGDPFGSAALFPLLSDGSAARSWDYRFVAGAAGGVDPLATAAASTAAFSVNGETTYSYGGVAASYAGPVRINVLSRNLLLQDFLAGIQKTFPRVDGKTSTTLNLPSGPAVLSDYLKDAAVAYFSDLGRKDYNFIGNPRAPTAIRSSADTITRFLTAIADDLSALIANPDSGLSPGKVPTQITAIARNFIRTGSGSIQSAAAGDIDLRNGADPRYRTLSGADSTVGKGYQVGGTAIYTLGQIAATGARTATDGLGTIVTVDPAAYLAGPVDAAEYRAFRYGSTSAQSNLLGVLIGNPVYAEGGGDVTLVAGDSVLGRRDVQQEAQFAADTGFSFIGAGDQPWRVGAIDSTPDLRVNGSLFRSGIATLGGGNIAITAGGDVSDLTVTALTTAATADASADGRQGTLALMTFGGGDLAISAGGDLVGGRIDLASGAGTIATGDSIMAGPGLRNVAGDTSADNGVRLRIADATLALAARGDIAIQGVAALGATQPGNEFTDNLDSRGFYSATSSIGLLADGSVIVDNRGADVIVGASNATAANTAVYPASVTAAALTGAIDLAPSRDANSAVIALIPAAGGDLRLLAGTDIAPITIQMDDRDPGQIPGLFSVFDTVDGTGQILAGQGFGFFGVLPDATTADRAALHNAALTHAGDSEPVRIAAGGDIAEMILSTPKQTRISAGRDIVDMVFTGQNLATSDVTRVVAGRDITATTVLTRPFLADGSFGDPQPALQGNSFTIGGPGSFILEAGRNAGPFLNSASADLSRPGAGGIGFNGALTFGGGILSLGNENNPYLSGEGADVAVLFGVAKGVNFASLRETYLNPANLAALADDLFVQVADANGNLSADRTRPIYAPILIAWMQANQGAALTAAYGTTDVNFAQAYATFASLPLLAQRGFLTNDVYFNELQQTSVPTSVSYLKYSRGYRAVNTLFPPALGYTANNLEGGAAGASETIHTGDLDLRLATIQTSRGGSISLLGPGGRILAGSTVSTAEQAARRTYDGARLLAGDRQVAYLANGNPATGFSQIQPAAIQGIPTGYEGVLTLRGGAIRSFTDTDLLLNQSRLFTEDGGDIVLWSSNGDVNAGQGPKTSANFPPVVVRIDANGYAQVDAAGGVSGAGIAAFQPSDATSPPNIYLIAPRGTVDAGDAGVRVAGNLFVAAAQVANADNFQVGGTAFGVVAGPVVDTGTQAAASAASAAAQQAAQAAAQNNRGGDALSRISVDVQGYAGSDDPCGRPGPKPAGCPPATP